MAPSYWLLKSEPEVYSFERLLEEKRTNWDHVRNFQARNFLKTIKKDDLTVIYHSGDTKAVVGVAKCVKEGYADIDADDGKEWVQIDIAPVRALANAVPLSAIKANAMLKNMLFVRQSRLSVSSMTKAEFDALVKLSEKPAAAPAKKKKATKK
jgi:predicted RNA-binding protein with PUA-like domain